MISTPELIRRLRAVHPDHPITEHILRHAVRAGRIERPTLFAGRYVWPEDAVRRVASAIRVDAAERRESEECS